MEKLRTWLESQGVPPALASFLESTAGAVLIILLAILADRIARHYMLRFVKAVIARTRSRWDDILYENRFFRQLAHLAPALVVYLLAPIVFADQETVVTLLRNGALVYMVILGILLVDSAINAGQQIYNTYEVGRLIPIKSFVQVLKLVVYFVGIIIVISLIVNRSPMLIFSGLGAMTAVIMLIFKDAILGFVAGIQLTANKMVKHGDWIEMPKYGADGEVLEVALTTVKVQNWDKTITTIPTYALISESFKNWRGMQESGGRRIKRAIYIDMNTIKLCDAEMLERFRKIQYISEYIDRKLQEVEEYNRTHQVDDSSVVNGRRLTNIGTFRAYVEQYLRHHPQINQEMTFLVRHLAPSDRGLPLEIYVFCKDKRWAHYEAIQADIFDHLLAVIPEFELRVFQAPSGNDLLRAARYWSGSASRKGIVTFS